MRIGILVHELLVRGGTERQCVSLARELTHLGHDVVVFTNAYDREKCFPEICRDLEVRAAGRGWPAVLERPLIVRRFVDMRRLAACLEEAMDAGRFDVLNPHHWPPHWAAVEVKQHFNVPVVWMCNDVPDALQKSQVDSERGLAMRTWYRSVYRFDAHRVRQIDRTVVLDNRNWRLLSQSYEIDRIDVVRSGVDLEKFSTKPPANPIRPKYQILDNTFLILCLSSLMPHRRLEDAVRALAILRGRGLDAGLLIVGSPTRDPDYTQFIRATVESQGVGDAVIMADAFTEDDVVACYHACDVFLFPNEAQTWGLAVIEAMASGKPVVVSTGSGVHEVLEDRLTAMLVPPRCPEAIATRIEELIATPDLVRKLGVAGFEFVRGRFSWSQYACDMLQVFERAVRKETISS